MRAVWKRYQQHSLRQSRWLALLALLFLASCGLVPPPVGVPIWPTPLPAPPAYPTMEPKRWLGGSDPHATFQLPGVTFDVRVAVHPTQGWPAVAVLQRFNEGSDPIQAFVRVLREDDRPGRNINLASIGCR